MFIALANVVGTVILAITKTTLPKLLKGLNINYILGRRLML